MKYAGANVDFLDRETGRIKKAMMYPITKMELLYYRDDGLFVQYIMTVGEDGTWKCEEQTVPYNLVTPEIRAVADEIRAGTADLSEMVIRTPDEFNEETKQ